MVRKVVGAIVRVKESKDDEKAIPFGFKIKKDFLPNVLRSQNKWPGHLEENVVKIRIENRELLPSYIFAIEDSSSEVIKKFEANRKKPPLCNIKGLQEIIEYWINDADDIRVEVVGFLPIQRDRFDRTMKKFKTGQKSTEEKTIASRSSNPPAMKVEKNTISSCDRSTKIPLIELEPEISCKEPTGLCQQKITLPKDSKFKVPKIDETFCRKSLIFIEGKLPIKIEDYKTAISNLRGKVDEGVLIRNIVKYAFPKHWVNGVSLTGHSTHNKLSLISLWNYRYPLDRNNQGPSLNGLGTARLKALIEHVLRKANKMEYSEDDERNLKKVLSSALSHKRNEPEPKKLAFEYVHR